MGGHLDVLTLAAVGGAGVGLAVLRVTRRPRLPDDRVFGLVVGGVWAVLEYAAQWGFVAAIWLGVFLGFRLVLAMLAEDDGGGGGGGGGGGEPGPAPDGPGGLGRDVPLTVADVLAEPVAGRAPARAARARVLR